MLFRQADMLKNTSQGQRAEDHGRRKKSVIVSAWGGTLVFGVGGMSRTWDSLVGVPALENK